MIIFGIDITNIFLWFIGGIVAGFFSYFLLPGRAKGGIFIAILLAVAGSLMGASLAATVLNQDITLPSLSIITSSIAGAAVMVLLQKTLFRETKQFRTRIT